MIICPKCSAQLNDGARFCPECGTQITQPPVQQAPVQQAPAQSYSQPVSGYNNPDVYNNTPVAKPKSNINKIVAIIASAAVVIVAITALLIYFLSVTPDKESDSSEKTGKSKTEQTADSSDNGEKEDGSDRSVSKDYDEILNDVAEAFLDRDTKTLADLSAPTFYSFIRQVTEDKTGGKINDSIVSLAIEMYYNTLYNQVVEPIKSRLDSVESIDYEIVDTKKVSEAEMDEFRKGFSIGSGYDADEALKNVTNVVAVKINIVAEGGGETSEGSVSIALAKENGKWYLFVMAVKFENVAQAL